MNDRPQCLSCNHALRPDLEAGRLVCRSCEDRVRKDLNALAGPSGLFAQLVWVGPDVLAPGSQRHQGGGGGSSVEAPAPVRLGPMNLLGAGGVVHTLQRWVAAWFTELGFRQPVWRGDHHFVMMVSPGGKKVGKPGQLDNAVTVLLNNLIWAAEHRHDFDRFARDVRRFVEQIEAAMDPGAEQPIRVVVGRCPVPVDSAKCGELLQANPFATSIRCRKCGTSWPRAEWAALGDQVGR